MANQQPQPAIELVRKLWNRGWLPVLVLLLATVLVYHPAWHAGFIWDDDAYVTANPALRTDGGLKTIWLKPEASPQYYPLVFTTFWAEYHFWKLEPFGYHLINILLHATNAILLWLILRRLKVAGAWWAAAFFAVHPVMVESVAWVTERKNVLSGLFYLLAVMAFFKFRPLTKEKTEMAWHWRFYPLVLVLFLCALLSKTVTCTLPAALLLLVWWKTGRIEKRDVLATAPMFVAGTALGLTTAWLETHHVGASGPDWALTGLQRCLLAGRVLWFYAGKLLWPHPLIFIYPHWQIDPTVWWQYLFPMAALGVVIALWALRHRVGKGPLVAVLFFAGTLAPALGFINVYPFRFSYVADHFQYLASIGLITLAVGAGTMLFLRAGRWGRAAGTLTGILALLGLGTATWRQTGIYQDAETLWQNTLKENPGCWLAENNLGVLMTRQNKFSGAIRHCENALRLKPDYPDARFNLGYALLRSGKLPEAIAQFKQAIRLKPNFPEAYNSLANALYQMKRAPEAIADYQEAIRLNPDYADAENNLANVLALQGNLDEAIVHYRRAVAIKPDFVEAHRNMANMLVLQGRLDEAIGQYRKVVELAPKDAEAHYQLGIIYGQRGQLDKAIPQFQQTIALKPGNANAHGNLANAFFVQGKLDAAIREYQRTLALSPDSAQAHFRLAQALAKQKKFADAIAEYRRTLKLDPQHLPARLALAWLLATCPTAALRDGQQAVALAQRAEKQAGAESHQLLDTLAAAYAEAGQFPQAVETARRALKLNSVKNDPSLTRAIQSRLRLYQAHQPFHERP